MNQLKKNLQNDIYMSIEYFQEDIDKLKQKYNEKMPNFTGKTEIILEVCQ